MAIVTGAGTGLGRSYARLLADRGAKVVVNDLAPQSGGPSTAAAVVQEIQNAGGEAAAANESVADQVGAGRIVEAALDNFGRLDIVVNNAGILRDQPFIDMDMDDFEYVVRVHLLGTTYVTKAAWGHLMGQNYGRVVVTSSASGLGSAFGQANYGAAKAGIVGLMVSLKNEGLRSNVLVNAITPFAGTQMTDGLIPTQVMRLADPDHVAPAVAWLCSEDCDVHGEILSAGAGYYGIVKIMKSQGVVLDPNQPATVEDFLTRKAEIFDLRDAQPYAGTIDARTKEKLGLWWNGAHPLASIGQ
ncbi:SDR family NAD(P)-dependent oxidoreductase [Novosphingobium sp. 9U]|uniref:SDR family NAD(P)-dependent oxidoreductase n=1 Tax=Novosphingobium sp. 9U TaxID=2653158 RepID=UPI001F44F134|nr:SDR family NAD(P)-dependent oxidoreductase [Novosphingobium sp. 9U]